MPKRRTTVIYLIINLAYGILAVVAGIMVVIIGLRDTTYIYGLVVMVLATIMLVAVSRRRPSVSEAEI